MIINSCSGRRLEGDDSFYTAGKVEGLDYWMIRVYLSLLIMIFGRMLWFSQRFTLKLTWHLKSWHSKRKGSSSNHQFSGATVDRRNLAPVDMLNIPLFTGFIDPKWLFGISSINSCYQFCLGFRPPRPSSTPPESPWTPPATAGTPAQTPEPAAAAVPPRRPPVPRAPRPKSAPPKRCVDGGFCWKGEDGVQSTIFEAIISGLGWNNVIILSYNISWQ